MADLKKRKKQSIPPSQSSEKSTGDGASAHAQLVKKRKPNRGNRGGVGRRRKADPNKLGANGGADERNRASGGGKDEERRNRKRQKRQGKSAEGGGRDASDDERLEGSVALLASKKAKSDAGAVVGGGDEKGQERAKVAGKPVTFLDKMRARLSGGRFRMLNESLYTCKGHEAFELFQKDPGAFELYHTGYQEQMSKWPVLPVSVVTDWLKARSNKLVVADFGCGDARLSKSVKNKVFSLDLVSSDPSVIACNMANTPLESSSIDVAVFCLSLMGVDYPTFLEEAHRVLKPRGWLLIAEVKSRLDADNGGAGPQKLIASLKALGFALDSQDESNKMFHMFYFQKEGSKDVTKRKIRWPELKPCIYKKR